MSDVKGNSRQTQKTKKKVNENHVATVTEDSYQHTSAKSDKSRQ